jgi:hypothetical protein
MSEEHYIGGRCAGCDCDLHQTGIVPGDVLCPGCRALCGQKKGPGRCRACGWELDPSWAIPGDVLCPGCRALCIRQKGTGQYEILMRRPINGQMCEWFPIWECREGAESATNLRHLVLLNREEGAEYILVFVAQGVTGVV